MGSRISLHLRPATDFNQVVAAKLQTMKLLFPSLLLFLGVLGAFADPPMPAEGEEGSHSPPYYALANYLQLHWRGSYWLSTLQTRWALLTILNQRLAEPRDGGEGTSTGITKVTGSGSLLSTRLATSREERDQHSSHPWEPLWMITILLQDLLTTPTWLSWCRTRRPPLLYTMCTSKIFDQSMCTSKIRHNVHQ